MFPYSPSCEAAELRSAEAGRASGSSASLVWVLGVGLPPLLYRRTPNLPTSDPGKCNASPFLHLCVDHLYRKQNTHYACNPGRNPALIKARGRGGERSGHVKVFLNARVQTALTTSTLYYKKGQTDYIQYLCTSSQQGTASNPDTYTPLTRNAARSARLKALRSSAIYLPRRARLTPGPAPAGRSAQSCAGPATAARTAARSTRHRHAPTPAGKPRRNRLCLKWFYLQVSLAIHLGLCLSGPNLSLLIEGQRAHHR